MGPIKHSTAFVIVFSFKEKKLSTRTDAKIVVMMPLKKLAKLTFPSRHHIFSILKFMWIFNIHQHLFDKNLSILRRT